MAAWANACAPRNARPILECCRVPDGRIRYRQRRGSLRGELSVTGWPGRSAGKGRGLGWTPASLAETAPSGWTLGVLAGVANSVGRYRVGGAAPSVGRVVGF